MLRTIKSQRTRLVKKIGEEVARGEGLVEQASVEDQVEGLGREVAVSIALLGDFRSRFQDLSHQIAQGSEGRPDDELDREGEFVMDTLTDLTHALAQLSVAQSSPTLQGSTPSESSATTDMVNLQAKIDKLVELQSLQLARDGAQSPTASQSSTSPYRHSVNLPKLEFEKFSGNVLRFREFWDSFDAAVHSNPCIQPVEKLNYLRSYLAGEAKNVISGVSTCEANYEVAVELIQRRFGNPQASIDAHYSQLANLPIVPNLTCRVRSLFDEVEKNLRCLSALGEDTEHRHFISLIMSKLPSEVITRLEESKTDDEIWSVELLRKKLQSLLSAREAAERQRSPPSSSWNSSSINKDRSFSGQSSGSRPNSFKSWSNRSPAPHSTTESLVAGEKSVPGSSGPLCSLCSGSHFSDQCSRFRSIEERRRRLQGRCFVCLQKGHQMPQCTSTKPCFYCKQVKKHNRCLCPAKFHSSAEASAVTVEDSPVSSSGADDNPVSQHTVLSSGDKVLLQTATIQVKDCEGKACVSTRVLLDCASNRSYISSSLASKLQVKSSGSEIFSVVTFGSEKPKTVETTTAKVQIMLKDASSKTLDVNVVPKITGAIHRSPVKFIKCSFLWKDLPLADSLPTEAEDSPVDLLIGNDYYLDLVTSEKMEIGPGLYLLGSRLGWLLTGRVEGEKASGSSLSMFVSSLMNSSVPELSGFSQIDPSFPVKPSFEDFWKLESIGIMDKPDEDDDNRALAQFSSTVKMCGGRYEVAWPWKETCPDLPENYQLSLGRFKSLLKKFKSDPDLLRKYADIIKDQENKGIIEKVNDDSKEGTLKHYVPHHPVVNPQKTTTKVRIVYDASAKVRKDSKSLNECLLRGPVILEELCGLLLRFRITPVVVISDIEKAFLQVGLRMADRDVTRFFWLKDSSVPAIKDNLQVYRFCRVPFGVISSPFLLSATVKYHLQRSGSTVAQKICDNLYVDNVITGVDSPEEAVSFYREAKKIFQEASMNLREWASNSSEFLSQIPEHDKVKGPYMKVLGLSWNSVADSLSVSGKASQKVMSASTKREMLQCLASIFDPLGFFSPLTVKAKIFIHSLWKKDLEWDDQVSLTCQDEWKLVASELNKIPDQQIPRFVGDEVTSQNVHQLLCFCDASAMAYSAVVYLKIASSASSKVRLVFAKTRLPPSKGISMPRLELLAAVIGVRCLVFVQRQLRIPVAAKILWSDSQCVLHWMKSKKPLPVFVENRVREVKKYSDISFKYVNTLENPADVATRGKMSMQELNTSSWWEGPQWLSKDEDSWPVWKFDIAEDSMQHDVSAPDPGRFYEASLLSTQKSHLPPYTMNLPGYSSLIRLYRVTAWIRRFVQRLRKEPVLNGSLHSTEVSAAKIEWDRYVQHVGFPEIFGAIESGRKCSLKEQLNVQQDLDGILRCHGRFLNADLPEDVRYPKLLIKNCHYTRLVIRYYHEKLCHAGVAHTLSQVRLEYWIPQGRSVIRQFISACRICRRHDGGPFRIPNMPPYPSSRVTRSSPFSYTGLDYLGPLFVKSSVTQVQKVWVCLFTCLSVRAVHLELVGDMSAQQFLLCLRRFIARHGKPIQIISDNAAQFKLSKSVLDRLWGQALSDPEVRSYISSEGISWKFIVERAPWMGGIYERLVGSVKRALKKGLGKLCLTTDQMITSLTEIEAILNSRPLTYVDDDLASGRCITPNDFLSLNPNPGFPMIQSGDISDDPSFIPSPNSIDGLLSRWKKGHKLLDVFWKVWMEDYLSGLRERGDCKHRQSRVLSADIPWVGDVVLIKDDRLPRGSWKMGRVKSLFPGLDGQSRGVQLQLPSGKILNRSPKLLYPLEASVGGHEEVGGQVVKDAKIDHKESIASRLPKRKASLKAKSLMNHWISEMN